MLYEMCRKFADEEIAPNAREWDQKHEFPSKVKDMVRLRGVQYLLLYLVWCLFIIWGGRILTAVLQVHQGFLFSVLVSWLTK